jgi:hypothetical protein
MRLPTDVTDDPEPSIGKDEFGKALGRERRQPTD